MDRKNCPHYSEIQDMNATIRCCDLYGTGANSWGKCKDSCEFLSQPQPKVSDKPHKTMAEMMKK